MNKLSYRRRVVDVGEQKQGIAEPDDIGVRPKSGVPRRQDALQNARSHQHLRLERGVAHRTGPNRVMTLLKRD